MADFQCFICKNTDGNRALVAKEMMYGLREEFLYFCCASCGAVQLADTQLDTSRYYPNSYYSLSPSRLKKYFGGRFLASWYLRGPRFPGLHVIAHFKGFTAWVDLFRDLKKEAAILDIGCGSGTLLRRIQTWGYSNLTGVEPHISNDITYPEGVKIIKTDLLHHTGEYDLIMLHHSFEHMSNPREALQHLSHMLRPGGKILIRIPVADSFAFRKYGVSWYQLDAPRHIFLHTTKSIAMLAKECGLTLQQVTCDSTVDQFLDSEKYQQDIALGENVQVSPRHKKACKRLAKLLNRINDGDQACFVLSR